MAFTYLKAKFKFYLTHKPYSKEIPYCCSFYFFCISVESVHVGLFRSGLKALSKYTDTLVSIN